MKRYNNLFMIKQFKELDIWCKWAIIFWFIYITICCIDTYFEWGSVVHTFSMLWLECIMLSLIVSYCEYKKITWWRDWFMIIGVIWIYIVVLNTSKVNIFN